MEKLGEIQLDPKQASRSGEMQKLYALIDDLIHSWIRGYKNVLQIHCFWYASKRFSNLESFGIIYLFVLF